MIKRSQGLTAVSLSSSLLLAACGGTGRFVAQPPLSISNPQESTSQAVSDVFNKGSSPYVIQLCAADPASKSCTKVNDGLSAFGIGGPIFPLSMNVAALNVKAVTPSRPLSF